ncbi:bifunctional [glutamine synthetase] adenylyltransferase/[glutamine synthetase]-adenylyl-L-tyrosine phosphorylase [Azospirillum rugosum]|uniref:Bifunctional glutamine synthetase adenylyltransferase/adenylyl-removing enzyme n=1 Tax=Azospirillum rugosum TaxID=416170 RepID=A0ABS4SNR2_9PROT|nr:bifunctional [glutamine synthetase] adenylyltransferase/[glutamine synthetase]-adenylyl-L-tyrosine phosphorylase [Azospirillum rugosum]MBP2294197.1 glutamate-ammonia-ligase adenylyltransferase [Azospirillum rugosum]MDQ0527414.1 glutamate-ammonia-ligase adenylyltransferase [Azospirillum rugosum]
MPTTTLPKPFDPALAERGLERWRQEAAGAADEEVRAWAEAYADSAEGRAVIDAVCGNSPYLGQSLTRELPFLRRALTDGFDAAFADLLRGVEADSAEERNTDRLMTTLRIAKRRAALLIALADITDRWTLEQVTGALSDIAETSVRMAANHLLRRAAEAGTLTLPEPQRPWIGSGLIVLAMGKLGARELNYSSDIDLIVLYDDAVVQTPQPDKLARTFIRIARDLVRIMDERTRDGYVFRTDLRLRPDPGATPLAVSVSAAEIYYGSVGQNWERAAMIKARPIAGDPEAGRQFLRILEPFVWRRNLDFAAIQDIHSIKRQINAHKGHREVTVNGHDIKVGRGGIREIEFFAQTQQLIFGGRDTRVRIAPTLLANKALCAVGRVPSVAVEELEEAYRFLRRVEHRIQMIDDRQTHQIPADDAGVAHLATFLGYDDVEEFRADLLSRLGRVEDRYAELFEEAPSLSGPGNLVFTGTDDDPGTVETLRGMGYRDPSRVIAVVSTWHRGRYRSTRSGRARELLTELVPTILNDLAKTPAPDEALVKFDGFLGRLPAGVGLFSLFIANPWLLALVAEIMGTAPRLAETLSRNPSLLDAVISPDFFDPLPDRAGLEAEYGRVLAGARDFEDVLTLSRRWTNDQRFRAGAHILRGITDGDRCGPFLADLADVVVPELAHRVEEEFAARHGHVPGGAWVVVAMGKLGSRQLTITSDIDLIVVYEAPPEARMSDGAKPLATNEYYIKLTQRLTNAITAPMADGRLYEVDMRLRPSGNAGPLATSLEAFTGYQAKDAWTWEHMALTRARVIGGDSQLAAKVEAAIRAVLTRPRDPDKVLWDVADMRRRIDKEFGTDNPWNLKYARGGLIDIEFTAQYLQLRHGHDHPEILSIGTATALENATAAGLLAPEVGAELVSTLTLWRRVQGFLRLTTEDTLEPGQASPTLLEGLSRAAFPEEEPAVDFAALDARIRAIAARAHAHFVALVEEPASRLPPPETNEEVKLP